MNAQTQILQQLKSAMPDLRAKYPISRIALFGSATREDFDAKTSDIDVMVEFSGITFDSFINLAEELERLFGRRIDMVARESLKPRHWDYLKDKVVYA